MPILAEKNNEDAWLDEDDDCEDNTRTYWRLDACPAMCNCSTSAWRNAKAWSYKSPQQALGYVKNHLMASSLHHMSEEEADALLEGIEPEEFTEDFEERDKYRKFVLMAQTPRPPPTSPPLALRRRSRSPPEDRSLSSRKGKGKNNGKGMLKDQIGSLTSEVSHLQAALADLREAQKDDNGAASSGSIGARPIVGATQIVGTTPIVGSVDAMLKVRKSLFRAAQSCEKGSILVQALADQLKSEATVIRGAYETLDAVMEESLRRSCR